MKREALILTLVMCACALLPAAAQTSVSIDIRGGVDPRIPIAVPPFACQPGLESVAREMADVIAFDLDFSGLFTILPAAEYPAGFAGIDPDVSKLNLDPWRQTRAERLVFGVVHEESGNYVTELRVFDVASAQQVVGRQLRAGRDVPRLISHRFTEDLIGYTDGTQGIGTSEIAFSGGKTGSKEIYVSDYDGANIRQVTQHGSISILPQMSPDGNRIAYLSYKDRYSYLYLYDRRTGKSVPLSKEVGLNTAPAWAPDSSKLAIVLSKDANTEIYLRNADGSGLTRLTKNKFGDTSPCFDPTGSRIAFVSDRGGSPQIYAMGTDGSGGQRLSVQGGNSYDPEWSPDGKMIAYVAERRGEGLEIYIMDAATGQSYRRLTDSGGSNEAPTWSADSRHVMYSTSRNGRNELYAVCIKTGQERAIPGINVSAQGPSWGPRRSGGDNANL